MPNPHPLAGALDDVRVLDLTQNLPGPYATVLLAALGATVIKVEPPGGETARGVPSLFELVNRGKQSVVLDLKTERGREALLALAAECDVLVDVLVGASVQGCSRAWASRPPCCTRATHVW
jgi:CoA:oxalate CoA-transferase